MYRYVLGPLALLACAALLLGSIAGVGEDGPPVWFGLVMSLVAGLFGSYWIWRGSRPVGIVDFFIAAVRRGIDGRGITTPADLDPRIASYRADVSAGKHEPLCDAIRDAATHDERFYLVESLAERSAKSIVELLGGAEAPSFEARVLLGKAQVNYAWEWRGSGQASTVTSAGWRGFKHHLQEAQRVLVQAARERPDDPLPFAILIHAALGLGDEELADEAMARCDELHPHFMPAQWLYMSFLCEKWYGSHEQMWQFARAASDAAPEGSESHALIVFAHLEQYLYLDGFQHDIEFDVAEAQACSWLAEPNHQEEVRRAYERSLGSPDHRETPLTATVRSWFAYWFFRVGDSERMRAELSRLGGAATDIPWGWGPSVFPRKNVKAAYRLAGLEAR